METAEPAMRTRRCPELVALLVTLAASFPLAQALPPSSLLDRAAVYVQRYEERFAAVISDEEYEQRADGRSYRSARGRKIASEMMFLWLAGEQSWLSVRNVVSVDGHAIGNSGKRLDRLLSASAPVGVAHLRRMRDEGARFNIGTIRRNFNDPMFPLQFLEAAKQQRFTFSVAGHETIDGVDTSKMTFNEQASPTFIEDGNRNLPTHGIFWVADDGAVLRTRLDVLDPRHGMWAMIVVDYRSEERLDMLVPVTMDETYVASGPNSEHVDCTARYSGFRRFETAARIVPDR
jgi:hypothetical protein